MKNVDSCTVAGFGREWSSFDQQGLDDQARAKIFDDYFHLFPWQHLSQGAAGADIGCGSGRWAMEVAPRVGHLHLVDASSEAVDVARRNLAGAANCSFHHASVAQLPFRDNELDFAYSLGALHHVPDTAAAIRAVSAKLKRGAPFLLYLYYAFDNRPLWFRMLWRASDAVRWIISRLPYPLRLAISQVIAVLVYYPAARVARALDSLGRLPGTMPLAYYRDKPFYVMRTDALDRFGTRLEQRFSKRQIRAMLEAAGFANACFSDRAPFWCAVATKE
jgi:SAM-dependent methyltransferase